MLGDINTLPVFTSQESQGAAIVCGNEVKGVHQEVIDNSDGCIEIPQYGTKHSLNVSVTAGIVIWEFARRMIQRL
jgi:tRNA G18 (ribose-2'-O)-methylase SpoU